MLFSNGIGMDMELNHKLDRGFPKTKNPFECSRFEWNYICLRNMLFSSSLSLEKGETLHLASGWEGAFRGTIDFLSSDLGQL